MFKLEGFCDDKHAVAIMKSVAGLHIMDFKMVPVANAKAKNGKVVAETSGAPLDLLAHHIKRNKMSEITSAEFKSFAKSVGREPYYLVRQAIEAKLIKRKPGTPNHSAIYQVLR